MKLLTSQRLTFVLGLSAGLLVLWLGTAPGAGGTLLGGDWRVAPPGESCTQGAESPEDCNLGWSFCPLVQLDCDGETIQACGVGEDLDGGCQCVEEIRLPCSHTDPEKWQCNFVCDSICQPL